MLDRADLHAVITQRVADRAMADTLAAGLVPGFVLRPTSDADAVCVELAEPPEPGTGTAWGPFAIFHLDRLPTTDWWPWRDCGSVVVTAEFDIESGAMVGPVGVRASTGEALTGVQLTALAAEPVWTFPELYGELVSSLGFGWFSEEDGAALQALRRAVHEAQGLEPGRPWAQLGGNFFGGQDSPVAAGWDGEPFRPVLQLADPDLGDDAEGWYRFLAARGSSSLLTSELVVGDYM